MSIRSSRSLVGLLGASLLVAGCSSSASPTTAPATAAATAAPATAAATTAAATTAPVAGKQYSICFLTASEQTPYSTGVNVSSEAEAKALGVKYTRLNSELDPALQSSQVDECIAQKADGIIVVANDAKGIVPALKKASEAGILVLADGAPVDKSADPYTLGFAGPGDFPMAQMAGKMACDYLPNGGNIAIIAGSAGFGPTILREDGFRDALKACPSVKVIDSQFADWSRQKAIQISADMLTKYGDTIDLFYTMDDDMGVGVIQSIKAANAKAKVVSLTAFPDSCQFVESGDIIGTVIQSSAADGKNAIDVMVKALNGETIPRENYMDTPQLTKANLDQCPKS